MKYTDPITKRAIPVRSIYIPRLTLLQGKVYTRSNLYLNPNQGVLWLKK